MGDDSADDASNVTGSESDRQLSSLAVGILGLGEDTLVELLDDLLEEVELYIDRRDRDSVRHTCCELDIHEP